MTGRTASGVMTTFNREEYSGGPTYSIIAQAYLISEPVIRNDGSGDRTV